MQICVRSTGACLRESQIDGNGGENTPTVRVGPHALNHSYSQFYVWCSSWSLFASVYLVMHWSESNHNKRITILQKVVLVMNIFSSHFPHTRTLTHTCLDHLGRTLRFQGVNLSVAYSVPDLDTRQLDLLVEPVANSSFYSLSFFDFLYLGMHCSECHYHPSTIVLQTCPRREHVRIPSCLRTRWITHSRLERFRTNHRTQWDDYVLVFTAGFAWGRLGRVDATDQGCILHCHFSNSFCSRRSSRNVNARHRTNLCFVCLHMFPSPVPLTLLGMLTHCISASTRSLHTNTRQIALARIWLGRVHCALHQRACVAATQCAACVPTRA
jgi:hypothetical protein